MNILAQNNQYDVIVLGTDSAGFAIAIPLVAKGYRVLILAKENATFFSVGENLEASAKQLFHLLHYVCLPTLLSGFFCKYWSIILKYPATFWHHDSKPINILL